MQRFNKSYSVNKIQFRLLKKISEGAYGDIYSSVSVTDSNKFYAVKLMRSSSKESHDSIENEISILSKVSKHVNIVEYYGSVKTSMNEFLLLMEFCPNELSKLLLKPDITFPLPLDFIVKCIGQICSALDFMHNLSPKLIHRDIKVENTLIGFDGLVKICDLGSSTRRVYMPEELKTTNDKLSAEEEIHKNTTPLYRSPEMCDLYCNFPINEKSDIWALNCILYKLLTGTHPFESGEKLAICNIKYNKTLLYGLNQEHRSFLEIIDSIFLANPYLRPSAIELLSTMTLISEKNNIIIFSALIGTTVKQTTVQSDSQNLNMRESDSSIKDKADIFSKMKKHSELLVNRMKDVGNVVKSAIASSSLNDTQNNPPVQRGKPRIAICKKVTSKILIISSNVLNDTVRESLESISANSRYMLVTFNDIKWLDLQSIKINTVIISSSDDLHPGYDKLLGILSTCLNFLQSNSKNSIVFLPGENTMRVGFYICALLILTRSFNVFEEALNFFVTRYSFKRINMVYPPPLGSMKRYCNYIKLCAGATSRIPVLASTTINRLKLKIPNISTISSQDIQPVIEVYNTHILCFTLRRFTFEDNDCIVFEAGNTIVGATKFKFYFVKQEKWHPIFNCSFHTCFLSNKKTMTISGVELDPCLYMYVAELQNWSIELDLFFVHSSVARYLWNKETAISFRDPSVCFKTSNQFVEATNTSDGVPSITEQYRNFWSNVAKNEAKYPQNDVPEFSLDFLSMNVKVRDIFDDLIGFTSHNEDSKGTCVSSVVTKTENDFVRGEPTRKTNRGSNTLINTDIVNTSVVPELCTDLGRIFSNEMDLNSLSQVQDSTNKRKAVNLVEIDFISDSKIEDDKFLKQKPNYWTNLLQPDLLDNNLRSLSSDMETKSQHSEFNSRNSSCSKLDLLCFESPYRKDSNISSNSYVNKNPANNRLFEETTAFTGENVASNSNHSFNEFDPFGFVGSSKSNLSYSQSNMPHSEKNSNIFDDTLFNTYSNDVIKFGVNDKICTKSTQFLNTTTNNSKIGDLLDANISFSNLRDLSYSKETDLLHPRIPVRPLSCSSTQQINENNFEETSSTSLFKKEDAFRDLLSDSFFGNNSNKTLLEGKKSLNKMHENRENALNSDPIRRKVDEWSRGKQKDIRKLLSTLHLILWDGVTKWTFVGESQLRTTEDVKLFYKKACLIIHPDRLLGSPHEALARNIFDHISEAYKLFDTSGFGK